MKKNNLSLLLCILMISSIANIAIEFSQTEAKNISTEKSVSGKILVVNQKQIDGNLILYNDHYYVSIEDLIRNLDGSIKYQGNKIIIELQPTPIKSGKEKIVENGTAKVKGTLTYYFNDNYGNKPDTGSKIFVVNDWFDISESEISLFASDQIIVGLETQNGKSIARAVYKPIKVTIADGNGNYEVSDLPSGNYTLVFQSNHSKGLNRRDFLNKIKIVRITLNPNGIKESSHDFGMSER